MVISLCQVGPAEERPAAGSSGNSLRSIVLARLQPLAEGAFHCNQYPPKPD